MRHHVIHSFRALDPIAVVIALAAAATISACGSSSPAESSSPTKHSSTTARASYSSDPTLAFSQCMRANGVPNFPDIGATGMHIGATQGPGGQTLSVDGVSVNAPAFAAARQTCQKYLPHVIASPTQDAQDLQTALKFSECMRSHGVAKYPDPKITVGPGGGQGVDLRGTGLNFQSPAFQTAASCGGGPKGP